MGTDIQSVLDVGLDGVIVDAECHLSNGLPSMIVVGLGGKAVDEAKERIRSALASSSLQLPRKRITINLAPADIPKESTSLDLAIAAVILQSSSQTKQSLTKEDALIGELGLDGTIRPVRGIIGKLLAGKKAGIKKFYIPEPNKDQALLVPNITVVPLKNIRELYMHLNGQEELAQHPTKEGVLPEATQMPQTDHGLKDVVGQQRAKRAVEIAAAGGHNLFLSGPPGTGKSMLAKALPSIMPKLNQEEMLEVTHLHSLVGGAYDKLIMDRPFRSPHHSASHIAIVGGGHNLRPGEISLAHRGILFIDELPEFNRVALEALRQPLEDNVITVARAKDTVIYPAQFILIATANPCPCGYYGTTKPCNCSAGNIMRYRQKLSGPIMDRIDLQVDVEQIEHEKLLSSQKQTDSDDTIRKQVKNARQIQLKRFSSRTKLNGNMANRSIKTKSRMNPDSKEILNEAAKRLDISARSYMRMIKVARTIADLDGSADIEVNHITEALQYRPQTINPLD